MPSPNERADAEENEHKARSEQHEFRGASCVISEKRVPRSERAKEV